MRFRDELKPLVIKDVKIAMAHNHRVLGQVEIIFNDASRNTQFPTYNIISE